MSVKQGIVGILRAIFPPPRHRFHWAQTLPLLGFLIVYAAACVLLEKTDQMLFERPEAFGLIVFTVWLWWMSLAGYAGQTRTRARVSLIIRLLLAGVFVMVLAEPRAVRTKDVVSVVYALDVSDSIGQASVDDALEFIANQTEKKPQQDEAGLVVFGGTAAVELPPRESFWFEKTFASRVQRDATDIERSLSLAAAMLPEENRGRIVLISDGTSTSGSLSRILDEMKSRDIAVDVLPIDYQYDREVWIERLELPQYVKLGEDYQASVIISSLQDGDGTLVLRENNRIIHEEPYQFKAGKNRKSVTIPVRDTGYYEYKATLEVSASQDNLRQNNEVVNYLFVEGEGKVMIVSDGAGDARDYQKLEETLRKADRHVEVKTAFEFPDDALSLMPYDCVVWVNVAADAFSDLQMQALHDAVRDLGTGFLMIGGENSFGPGGYHRTVIEKALPVTMDVSQKKVLPKGALAIILHTCEFADGNTWGKRITKKAIDVLMPQDEIGVLIYGPQGEDWLFELTPRSERAMMFKKINGAEIGDMPSFARTMKLGLEGLKKSDAAAKHMIIISDGDPQPPPPKMVQEYIDEGISISMIAIFPHGGEDISKMRAIAGATKGRYYFPSDPALLPSIFIKESRTLKRKMVQEKEFLPEAGIASPILKGLETMRPLHGYVLTSLKPEAEPILQTPLGDKPDEEEHDPVLARWRYGLGSTAAFTSDFSPRWGKDWVEWQKFEPLVKQLVTDISRVRTPGQLRLWSYASGGEGVIMVEDFSPEDSFLEIAAHIAGPNELSETIQLKQISSRRYQARVPLWGQGRYQVIARGTGSGRNETITGGFIVPYSPEYLRFRSNPIVLDEIRERTGGELLDSETPADVVFGRRNPKKSSSPVFDWFLIALACLLPLDVAVRRVQIDWWAIRNIFAPQRQEGPATATTGTLLQRKQAVSAGLEARRGETPKVVSTPMIPRVSQKAKESARAMTQHAKEQQAKKAQEARDAKTKSTDAPKTTTSQLLAMKRKRQEDQDDE